VCQEPGADRAYFPCRHLCVCESCANQRAGDSSRTGGASLGLCPACNEAAESIKKIYF
jgi:hypothetical protein